MDVKGIPEELWVRVTRKLGDNEFGSFGTEAELKVSLSNVPDLDLTDTFLAVHAWLSAAVGKATVAQGKETSNLRMEASATMAPEPVAIPEDKAPPPPRTEAPPSAPEASVSDSAVENVQSDIQQDNEFWKDSVTISHQITQNGNDYINVRGERWQKHGASAWPEVVDQFINLPWRDWPVGTRYNLPDGLQEARVSMKISQKTGGVVPDKVIGFR